MKKLLAVGLVAATAAGGWKLAHRQHNTDDGSTRLTDRLWIDRMPKNDRDFHDVLLVLTKDNRGNKIKFGIIQRASAWSGKFNSFKYELAGNEMKMTFPQNGHSATVKTEVHRCSEGPFDLCLDVTNQRGTMRFYSSSKWQIGSELDAKLLDAKLLAKAPAAPADYVPAATDDSVLGE